MREEKIRQLVQEILDEDLYTEYFLVSVKAPDQSHKIQVFLDGDNGISFGTCQSISRKLEATLDEVDWVPVHYILEVSSPGVKRSLLMLRQYPQHIGRELKFTLTSEESFTGILEDVVGSTLIVNEEKTIKKGKGRKKIQEQVTINFDQVKEAIVKISFKK